MENEKQQQQQQPAPAENSAPEGAARTAENNSVVPGGKYFRDTPCGRFAYEALSRGGLPK